jgi:hypothetical protein
MTNITAPSYNARHIAEAKQFFFKPIESLSR